MKKISLLILCVSLSFIRHPVCAQASEEKETIGVVVTVLPLAYFVETIGGDNVDVSVMIPPGGNPHTYEPTPSQLKALSDARMYVRVGSGIDFELDWMNRLASLNKDMLMCDCSQGIPLIDMEGEHHEHAGERYGKRSRHQYSGTDPHIWLAPSNAIIMAATIRDALMSIDPDHKSFYTGQAAVLISELGRLKREIEETLRLAENRSFLIFHPSWGYFAAEFGLTQIAAEQGGKEPSPRQLVQLIRQAQKQDIKVIFVSPQFSQKSARVIAHEIKGTVRMIDPLAKDYIENLRKAASAFGNRLP